MAKKVNVKIQDVKTVDFENHLKTLEITEIIDLYFKTFFHLVYAMRGLLGFSLKGFEYNLNNADFIISTETLCKQLENQILKNAIDYNEKLFNIITIKINDIESILLDEEFITDYNRLKTQKIDLHDKYFAQGNPTKLLFVVEAIHPNRGTLETFHHETLKLFNDGKSRINNLFSLKKLNTPASTQPQRTPPPVKQIEPIKWQKDSVLLAYLINELKTYGFIDETNIWAICEQLFVDKKGTPIKATTFSSMIKNYENNQTTDNTKGKPKKHHEISTLIEVIKKKSKENNS